MNWFASHSPPYLLSGQVPDKSGHDRNALTPEYPPGPKPFSHYPQYEGIELTFTTLPMDQDTIRTYSDMGSSSLDRVLSSDNKRRWTTYRMPDTGVHHMPDKGTGQQPIEWTGAHGVDNSNKSGLMPDKDVHIPDKEGVMPDSPKRRTRVSPELTKARILELCQGTYLTPKELASQLGKNTHYISNNFIYPLVQEGRLRPKFPGSKRKDQAYTTAHP